MTDIVPIPSPGVPFYFGEPGGPLVVLLHDWYGRLPWLENYARALEHQGYRVVVPDLFDGVATTDEATAQQLLNQMDVSTALATIDEIIRSARAEGTRRVGVVGFSAGGWLALLHAQGGAADAVVAYYATLEAAQHGVIPCPVLLHFAEVDEWHDGEDPESFIDRLKEHGTPVTQFTYLATVHSFANATIVEKVNVAAAALAFARTASFLEDHLID
jgi:carboxymethylenebutenolidase